jgi:hypothetical protein
VRWWRADDGRHEPGEPLPHKQLVRPRLQRPSNAQASKMALGTRSWQRFQLLIVRDFLPSPKKNGRTREAVSFRTQSTELTTATSKGTIAFLRSGQRKRDRKCVMMSGVGQGASLASCSAWFCRSCTTRRRRPQGVRTKLGVCHRNVCRSLTRSTLFLRVIRTSWLPV